MAGIPMNVNLPMAFAIASSFRFRFKIQIQIQIQGIYCQPRANNRKIQSKSSSRHNHEYHQCASTTTQLTRIIILHIQQEVIVSCKGELHYHRYKITPGPDPPTPHVIDWEASAKTRKVLIWKPQTWGIATLIGRIGTGPGLIDRGLSY